MSFSDQGEYWWSTTAIMDMIVQQNSKIGKLTELMIEWRILISSANRSMDWIQVADISPSENSTTSNEQTMKELGPETFAIAVKPTSTTGSIIW
ncbi:hypothetical protein GJ496_010963 [Pomphorhynchus laevis]|nr:hypothetical protein GJ496_010963 [Pomphorhynchus laevis]